MSFYPYFHGRTQKPSCDAKIMNKPLIVVNFKTYETASGDTAFKLAKAMDNFSDREFRMIAVVSAFDLSSITNAVQGVEVWS